MPRYKYEDTENLPHYNVVFDENNPCVINLVSAVKKPAIKTKGMLFSDIFTEDFQFKAIPDQQRIIAPVLIPDVKIVRRDKDGAYTLTFSAEVISKLKSNFNRMSDNHKINLEHSKKMIDGFIDSQWIVKDLLMDQTKFYELEVPVGTWIFDVLVDDKDDWELVKDGDISGFSIEAMLSYTPANLSEIEYNWDEMIDSLTDEQVLNIIKDLDK